MHELSLCAALIDHATQAAGPATRIVRIVAEVGALASVDVQALRFGFAAAARGTAADGAQLDIVSVPGQARCTACGATALVTQRYADCPHCGAPLLAIDGGSGVVLKRIEVA